MCDGRFNADYSCPLCNRLHAVRQCTRFLVMTLEKKLRAVAHHGLCTNCLAQSHRLPNCRSIDRCRRCMQDHNSLLHPMSAGTIWFEMTAQVRVITHPGARPRETRLLIDPNAARSSITFAEALHLGCIVRNGRTTVTIYHRRYEKRRVEVECAVEHKKYNFNPESRIGREWNKTRAQNADIAEADLWWFDPARYSIILGADVTKQVLIGPAAGRPGQIYSQETVFGQAYFGEGRVAPRNPELEK